MCKWGTSKVIHVIRRNHPDIADGWHPMGVDACIADYIQEMNSRGIITIGCCCGHGKVPFAEVWVDMESEPLMLRYGYGYQIVEHEYLHEDRTPYAEKSIKHRFIASSEVTP